MSTMGVRGSHIALCPPLWRHIWPIHSWAPSFLTGIRRLQARSCFSSPRLSAVFPAYTSSPLTCSDFQAAEVALDPDVRGFGLKSRCDGME